ncbi:MAG: helix-turn-helix transcriptional regulator [bacterium]|nr:helix-turn-helix transcriptional regulator [bacterium]
MDFSQNLLHLIKNANKYYRLAQNIGVSQSTVANWLNYKSTPRIKNQTKLLNTLMSALIIC